MNKCNRLWLIVLPLVLLASLVLTVVLAGPWWAIRGIEQALADRSPTQLERHIDFPALRVNLRAQLQDQLVRAAGPDVQASGLGALALGVAGGLGGAGIDAAVTPAGVVALLHGQGAWRRLSGQRRHADTYAVPAPPEPFAGADWRYESLSRFTVTRSEADGRRTTFVLERQGLRWRLVDVRLPEASALLHLLD